MAYKRLTAQTFRNTRERLGFTADKMAQLCGASSGRVVRKWEAGDNDVPEGVCRFLWLLHSVSPVKRTAFIDIFMRD